MARLTSTTPHHTMHTIDEIHARAAARSADLRRVPVSALLDAVRRRALRVPAHVTSYQTTRGVPVGWRMNFNNTWNNWVH
jgi:hypothetical protein